MVKGKGAWSFTLMFLQMWALCNDIDEDFAQYYSWQEKPCTIKNDGLVQPLC